MDSNSIHIYGIHPFRQALQCQPDTLQEVFLANNFENESLRQEIDQAGIPRHSFQPDSPPRTVTESDAHQGIVAKVNTDKLTVNREEFLASVGDSPGMNVAVLGELQDPQNVGAIIRSAAAFGFGGIMIPQHRQAQITPAVVKVSAGMAFRIPLVSIGNVNNTIEKLKKTGFWVYGLDESRNNRLDKQEFNHDVALVIGNEAKGIRVKTKEHCDKLVRIPTQDNIPLNAAAAGAVGCYAVSSM